MVMMSPYHGKVSSLITWIAPAMIFTVAVIWVGSGVRVGRGVEVGCMAVSGASGAESVVTALYTAPLIVDMAMNPKTIVTKQRR